MVIALDLMHEDIPVLISDGSLKESLEVFARHDGERLPVVNNAQDRLLVGAPVEDRRAAHAGAWRRRAGGRDPAVPMNLSMIRNHLLATALLWALGAIALGADTDTPPSTSSTATED
ncbi:MAG: hypothetical protein WDO13_17370 [Verrucomicrobiota bacterium]